MSWTLESARKDYKMVKVHKKCCNCEFCSLDEINNPYFGIGKFYNCKVKRIVVNNKLFLAETCKYFTYKIR